MEDDWRNTLQRWNNLRCLHIPVLSAEPETTRLTSGENATEYTSSDAKIHKNRTFDARKWETIMTERIKQLVTSDAQKNSK